MSDTERKIKATYLHGEMYYSGLDLVEDFEGIAGEEKWSDGVRLAVAGIAFGLKSRIEVDLRIIKERKGK